MDDQVEDKVTALLEQLCSAERPLREAARAKLLAHFRVDGRVTSETPAVIPRLAGLVRRREGHGRSRALNLITELAVDTRRFALGFDPNSRSAKQGLLGGGEATFAAATRELSSLIGTLDDPSPAVRVACAHYLTYVGAQRDPRARVLAALDTERDPRVTVSLAIALGVLDATLRGPAHGARLERLWADSKSARGIAPAVKEIYTAVLSLPAALTVQDPSVELLESVVDASALARQDAVVLPFLEGNASGLAMWVLSKLGGRARAVLTRLTDRLRDVATRPMAASERQREKMRIGEIVLAVGFASFEGRGNNRVTAAELSDEQRRALTVFADVGAVGDLGFYGLPGDKAGIAELIAPPADITAPGITAPDITAPDITAPDSDSSGLA